MSTVKVFNTQGTESGEVAFPKVFAAPIRKDIIQFSWMNMKRNTMQPYGVYRYAGVEHAAHSWGPGRAVARVPRAHGGIGAYASMCRGGHMFGPTEVTRRWHRKTNVEIKRYAVASAIAASQVNSIVEAHGHRTAEVPALPLVVDMTDVKKTKEAVGILKAVRAYADVEASEMSRHKRPGKGGYRNRRYVQKKGPLVVYAEGDNIDRGFRALPGVTMANVDRLNLLDLAPGGQPGRFVIWTKNAFNKLDEVYEKKNGFRIPTPIIKETDFTKFKESQTAIKKEKIHRVKEVKVNPFQCPAAMKRLNPAWK